MTCPAGGEEECERCVWWSPCEGCTYPDEQAARTITLERVNKVTFTLPPTELTYLVADTDLIPGDLIRLKADGSATNIAPISITMDKAEAMIPRVSHGCASDNIKAGQAGRVILWPDGHYISVNFRPP